MINKIGVVGLGLIGGSMVKALKGKKYDVFGADISSEVISKAIADEVIKEELTAEKMSECDVIIIAITPNAAIEFIKNNACNFKENAIVCDCCGVKEIVYDEVFEMLKEKNISFVGGHPMAGREVSGYDNSLEDLYKNASMILCEDQGTDKKSIEILSEVFLNVGFKQITISTSKRHDEIIAFTSQLAHVVSNAYVKSDISKTHLGFSAGSYKDLTRVAKLSVPMWTELFLLNKDSLTKEIDDLADRLLEYSKAIKNGDEKELSKLLQDGVELKELLG